MFSITRLKSVPRDGEGLHPIAMIDAPTKTINAAILVHDSRRVMHDKRCRESERIHMSPPWLGRSSVASAEGSRRESAFARTDDVPPFDGTQCGIDTYPAGLNSEPPYDRCCSTAQAATRISGDVLPHVGIHALCPCGEPSARSSTDTCQFRA